MDLFDDITTSKPRVRILKIQLLNVTRRPAFIQELKKQQDKHTELVRFQEFLRVIGPLEDNLIIAACVLSVLTLLITIISWINIEKWRTLKNFIYLNIISGYAMMLFNSSLNVYSMVPYLKSHPTFYFVTRFLRVLGDTSTQCWIFVASVATYMDLVKVFSFSIDRVRLKCCLFAWGIPLVNTIYVHCIENFYLEQIEGAYTTIQYVMMSIFYLLAYWWVLGDFLIYLRVVYSLFNVTIRVVNRQEILKKLQIATFIFFLSGTLMLPGVVGCVCFAFQNFYIDMYKVKQITTVIGLFEVIILNLCFLVLKPNRVLWRDYWRRRRNQAMV